MVDIGFLGLGRMGAALARRLIDAGHDGRIWNGSPDAATPLVRAGARLAETPREALAATVSLSMLADDKAALSVLNESEVALARGIHVNTSSISGDAAEQLERRFAVSGVAHVSAPVLGSPAVAAAEPNSGRCVFSDRTGAPRADLRARQVKRRLTTSHRRKRSMTLDRRSVISIAARDTAPLPPSATR